MIGQLVQSLAHMPAIIVYGFIFVWLAAESCGAPIPNEFVLLLAGSLVAQRGSTLVPVLLVIISVLGSLTGAYAAYIIGMRGGRQLVLRYGKHIGVDENRLDAIEKWFSSSGMFAIVVARITPFIRTIASFPAGMLRFDRRSFLIASAAGSLLWCSLMVGLGVALGVHYTIALRLIEEYTVPAVVVLVAIIAGYYWLHQKLKHFGEPSPRKQTGR